MISAQIIEDSISHAGKRITTMQLKYPRFIHSEFMTHRVFSRNASSSRAIPVAKMIEQVRANPAMPVHWGKNQPGMQAHEELDSVAKTAVQGHWGRAAFEAAEIAQRMADIGAHKQVVNRILEPFQYISVIVTATEWDNFFELRNHPDAQPEIRALALLMDGVMRASTPRLVLCKDDLTAAGWHLPYVTQEERLAHCNAPAYLVKLSVARCARVSYLTHEGRVPNEEEDFALYQRLVGGVPLHASPTEHQAMPLVDPAAQCRNFVGWFQNRVAVEEFTYRKSLKATDQK